MSTVGTRKTTDPGTHMIAPAVTWSSSGEIPPRRGTLRVHRVEEALGEREQRREDRVLHVGEQQVDGDRPARPARPARPRLHHRPPEEQRRHEEGRVLGGVPAGTSQRELVERRQVPQPRRRDERGPARDRMQRARPRTAAAPARRGTGRARSWRTAVAGRGAARSAGAPRSRSGAATIMRSRCCSMWTWSSRLAKASIGEAMAR